MTLSEIHDVDEISDRCSVSSRPVGTEDFKLFFGTRHDRSDDREQVGRLDARVFPKYSRRVAADWVEVAQGGDPHRGVGAGDISEDGFGKVLGPAVWRGQTSGAVEVCDDVAVGVGDGLVKMDEVVLLQRFASICFFAIDCGRGREHKVLDSNFLDSGQEVDQTADVVSIVRQGALDRFGDGLEGGKVDQSGNFGSA